MKWERNTMNGIASLIDSKGCLQPSPLWRYVWFHSQHNHAIHELWWPLIFNFIKWSPQRTLFCITIVSSTLTSYCFLKILIHVMIYILLMFGMLDHNQYTFTIQMDSQLLKLSHNKLRCLKNILLYVLYNIHQFDGVAIEDLWGRETWDTWYVG